MPLSYQLAPNVYGELATCTGAYGCLETITGSIVALVLWAGLSTGLLFAPRANIHAAAEALEHEYEAIGAEQDALRAFATRVQKLPTGGPTTTVESGGVGVISANSQPREMAALQQAYRETVMSVEHYDQDYGESLPVNLANEFGENVAGAVLANERLSSQIKQAVLASTHEGQAQRDQYLETLERERERLEDAGDALEDTAAQCAVVDGDRLRRHPFHELQERFEHLAKERDTLASMLEQRQERIQEGVTFGWQRRDSESVYRYLYRDIDATYPVLADGTRVLGRMNTVENRLTTALTAKA